LKKRILVITPVKHIEGVPDLLEKAGDVTYLEHPDPRQVLDCIHSYDAIYTNPNKSNVFISRELIDAGTKLKAICTASTGTNHIDVEYVRTKGIALLSLTEERKVIDRITSTAEHAFGLMIASLRKIPQSWLSVQRGKWDYLPFVGRQVSELSIGVVGYGRLGRLFAGYCKAFGAEVRAYDPYKQIDDKGIRQVELDELLKRSDVISLHVHVTPETTCMVNQACLSKVKPDLTLINTSRGEICDETAVMSFLESHPDAFYATDVISDEIRHKDESNFRKWALGSSQALITPHIGGMTREGQQIAFQHAAKMLRAFFDDGDFSEP
jgi:phosphoglycerate dehydrogenase-like enzyme